MTTLTGLRAAYERRIIAYCENAQRRGVVATVHRINASRGVPYDDIIAIAQASPRLDISDARPNEQRFGPTVHGERVVRLAEIKEAARWNQEN